MRYICGGILGVTRFKSKTYTAVAATLLHDGGGVDERLIVRQIHAEVDILRKLGQLCYAVNLIQSLSN